MSARAGAALAPLRAGPLSLYLCGADLRYAGVGGHEVLRRVYTAVRDLDWDTAEQTIVGLEVSEHGGGFTVTAEVEHRATGIALDAVVSIAGDRAGTLEYAMRARALTAFEYAKIGICLHHPIAGLAGRPYRAAGRYGTFAGRMPDAIAPQVHLWDDAWDLPIFPPFTELELEHEGASVRLTFEGDEFEVEDQRNWSDQSYKTSSTPAERGYRFAIEPGAEIVQRVRMQVRPARAAVPHPRPVGPPTEAGARVQVGAPTGRRLAPIGLGWTPAGDEAPALPEAAAALLADLRPAHLRLDLRLGADWKAALEDALRACARLRCALELALFLDGDPRAPLRTVGERLREADVPVARVLVFRPDEEATNPNWVRIAREHLGLEAPVGGGTNLYFNELNRSGVDLGPCDVVAYSSNPQIHAFDDLSMTEALEGQAEQLRSARALAGERLLAVSPITLRPRFNAVAVTDGSGSAPSNVDPRQATRFGAAWMLGSVAQLAHAGADALTYFETVGPRGVVTAEGALPAYHVLADLGAMAGGQLLRCSTGAEPWICALAISVERETRVLVANLTDAPRDVRLSGLTGRIRGRTLDADSEEEARRSPRAFRGQLLDLPTDGQDASIVLGAHAVATAVARG